MAQRTSAGPVPRHARGLTADATTAPAPRAETLPVAARTTDAVKVYGKGDAMVRALDGITVAFAKGQFSAIMGPSGSGQVDTAALPRRPRPAHIRNGAHRRRASWAASATGSSRCCAASASASSSSRSTSCRRCPRYDNIVLPLTIAGRKPDPAALAEVVRITGLGDRLKHRPNELSGGQQQRVAAARALASQPEIIFADEPTGNLDSRASSDLLDFLRHAVSELGQTIIMVTHDPIAAAHADRVVFLADGHVVQRDARTDGRQHPRRHAPSR